MSQPTFVPVRPSPSRRKYASSCRGSTSASWRRAVHRERDLRHAFASWIARQTFSPLAGMSTWRTPRWRERVDDGVVDGRRRADRPRLADPLRAERVQRGRRLHLDRLQRRELGGGRERVADEGAGQRVAVLVVDDLLVERLRDAGRDAAVHLALRDQRVDQRAGVVDGDEPQQLDRAGLGVDLDDGDVGAERERRAPPGTRAPPSARRACSSAAARAASSAHEIAACGCADDVEAAEAAVERRCRPGSPRGSRRRAASPARPRRRPRAAPPRRRSASTSSRTCRCPRRPRRCRPCGRSTFSTGSPSRSAAIIANVVSWPWPCENEPVRTIAPPSGGDLDLAELGLGDPVRDLDVAARRRCRAASRRPRSRRRALLGAQLVVAGRARAPARARPRSRRSRRPRRSRSCAGTRPSG